MKRIVMLAVTVLAGCSGGGTIVDTQRCPAVKPGVSCPEWTETEPNTLFELQEDYLRLKADNATCAQALEVWRRTWETCP